MPPLPKMPRPGCGPWVLPPAVLLAVSGPRALFPALGLRSGYPSARASSLRLRPKRHFRGGFSADSELKSTSAPASGPPRHGLTCGYSNHSPFHCGKLSLEILRLPFHARRTHAARTHARTHAGSGQVPLNELKGGRLWSEPSLFGAYTGPPAVVLTRLSKGLTLASTCAQGSVYEGAHLEVSFANPL